MSLDRSHQGCGGSGSVAAAAWRRQRGGGSVTAAAWRRRQPAMSLLIKLKTYPMAMLACVPASRSGMALDSSHQGCGGFGAAGPLGQCQIVYRTPVRALYSKARIGHIVSGSHHGGAGLDSLLRVGAR